MTAYSINKSIIGMALTVFLLVGSAAYADTTLVLKLQERLSQQSEQYADRLQVLKQLEESSQDADKWYEKARSLPEDSVDQKYAVAKYVNERARLMEPMIGTVQELRGINATLELTVERLGEAVSERRAYGREQNLNRFSTGTYEKALENLKGANALMAVMSRDPNIARRPEFSMVAVTHQQVIDQLRDATENPDTDQAGLLKNLAAVIEAQGVLMDVVEDRLSQDIRRLQLLGTVGTTSVVTARIKKIMDRIAGLFNGSYGQTARQQTKDLLRRTRPTTLTVNASHEGLAENREWLDKMRERGPLDK